MKKASLLAISLFSAVAVFGQNRTVNFETGKFADVLAKAKKENKPIMMDAYTTWCGPCKMMDKQVFTNDTVADYFNANFIPFKSDMEKGEGLELAKRYEVRAYPNFIFISPDGSVLHRSVGARPPHAFVQVGKEALNPEKRYAFYQKKYDAGDRSPEFLTAFAMVKERAALDSNTEIQAYFATQKPATLTSRQNWEMLNEFVNTTSVPVFKQVVDKRSAFNKIYTSDSVDNFMLRAYENDLQMALRKKNAEDVTRLKTDLNKLQVKNSEKLLLGIDAELYRQKGDMKNYALNTAKLVDTYYTNEPMALNSFAWNFYERVDDKSMLAKAEGWINKAVSMKPNYAFLDTQAAVLYKLGKKKEAKSAAENAIALGKKTGEDVAETEALLNKINALK